MQWTMPPLVLRIVAGLIGLVALSAFTLGIINAPQRGRLPGERPDANGSMVPLQATEATPLGEERIEGRAAPAPLTDEEKAQQDADRKAKTDAAKLAAAAAPAGPTAAAPVTPAPAVTPSEPPPPAAPPPDEAPH